MTRRPPVVPPEQGALFDGPSAIDDETCWSERAWAVLHRHAESGLPFSSDHVRAAVGVPPKQGMLGGLFAAASRAKIIKQCGWVRSGAISRKHGASALWAGVAANRRGAA